MLLTMCGTGGTEGSWDASSQPLRVAPWEASARRLPNYYLFVCPDLAFLQGQAAITPGGHCLWLP